MGAEQKAGGPARLVVVNERGSSGGGCSVIIQGASGASG